MNVQDLLSNIPFPDRLPIKLFLDLAARDHVLGVDAATGREYSYREIASRARHLAGILTDLGVHPGQRVAWSAPSGVDAIAIWFAIAQIGAVDVCVGDAVRGKLVEHIIDDCAPVVVIIHGALKAGTSSIGQDRRSQFKAVLMIDAEPSPGALNEIHISLAEIQVENRIEPVAIELLPSAPTTVIYTSGTTGASKGVVLCHHQQFFTGANYIELFRIHRGATLYHYSSFNHVTGRQLVVAAMLADAKLVFRSRFSLDNFWPDINRFGVSHSITLGSAVPLLLDRRDESSRNEGSLKYVWASPAMKIYGEFARRFNLKVVSPYGSTEVGTVVSPSVIPDRPGPVGNSGQRPKYFDLELLDENDQICAPGQVGEIAIRPRLAWTTFLGYLGRDGTTIETNRNHWYHTGDLGRFDENGYLFFVDRKQDFMRVKGENVSSMELEQILIHHPSISDCAVVPVGGQLADNDILAVIVPSANGMAFDAAELFHWCANQMPHYMVPRYFRVLEDMPRSSSGKIEKHKLRTEGPDGGTWDAVVFGLRATRNGVVTVEIAGSMAG